MRTTVNCAAFAALLRLSDAILVTQGSACDVQCGNSLSSTTSSDMTCDENAYKSSGAGTVFENCVKCELASDYTANNQTDLQWMLYNIRYATSYCLFGEPNNEDIGSTPCTTSHACGPLKEAITWKNLTTKADAYDYCEAWNSYDLPGCVGCLDAGDQHFLRNFVVMMEAACQQKPAPGERISIEGNPFSTVEVNVTDPTPTPLYTFTPDNSVLNLGARVGIAIGGILFILAVVGGCIVWNGKRRRQAFLRDLEKRHAHQGWPHPKTPHGSSGGVIGGPGGGPDMFETPLSQKPLRGWGDSPVSAVTETTEGGGLPLPRYFSPYASTYNSPVSAVGGPSTMNWPTLSPQKLDDAGPYRTTPSPLNSQPPAFTHWPTSTQEKLMQMQYEREQQAAADIGIALGGDEASLRSKNSNPQFTANGSPTAAAAAAAAAAAYEEYEAAAVKGKSRDLESYEMYEVDDRNRESPGAGEMRNGVVMGPGHFASNNPYRVPVEPQAPVLNHPGNGRKPTLHRRTGTVGSVSSSRSARYAGLTEEDARRGDAL